MLSNAVEEEDIMTVRNHAVIWVDHRVARIFYLGLESVDQRSIHAEMTTGHLHHKANTIGSGKAADDPTFFPRIDEALRDSAAILIVGPGNEKTLLMKHLEEGSQARKTRELHAEACDHPT